MWINLDSVMLSEMSGPKRQTHIISLMGSKSIKTNKPINKINKNRLTDRKQICGRQKGEFFEFCHIGEGNENGQTSVI